MALRWRWWVKSDMMEAGELFRRQHSAWLTEALSQPDRLPRIPIRRVDEGGFDALRARPNGMARSEAWWKAYFARMDRVGPPITRE